MHPTPSIILFTTASGAGYGLLFLVALAAPAGLVPDGRVLGAVSLALALGLITLGLCASTFHLGHPERAWRALSQWRSSWLSREGVAAVTTYVPAVAFAAGWVVLGRTDGVFALAAALAAAGSVLTVYCTGMIYRSLKPVREWHRPLVPWIYLAFALASGALLLHAVVSAFASGRAWIGWLALAATLLAFGLKLVYWRGIDREEAGPTTASATGLASFGSARMVEPPHTQTNYLLHEMDFEVGRRNAATLRQLALGFGIAGGAAFTLLGLAASGLLAVLFTVPAALAGLIGVAIERWLFFAEATHTVSLYYGRGGR